MLKIKISLLLMLALIQVTPVSAQQEDPAGGKEASYTGHEWTIHTGPYLPNQVDGVEEIQPTWGMRYGYANKGGAVEFGLTNSRAKGTIYNTASIALRGELPFEDMFAIFTVGADIHYYQPYDQNYFLTYGGIHLGSGALMHVAGPVWFRSDMQFNFYPGVALYIGFGLMLRPGASSSGAQE